jgi:hypothetical protein
MKVRTVVASVLIPLISAHAQTAAPFLDDRRLPSHSANLKADDKTRPARDAAAEISSRLAELRSQSQEVRDAAAKALRTIYVLPARTKWEPLFGSIKPGEKKATVLAKLQPYHVTVEMDLASGGSYVEEYRLHDRWLLRCGYRETNRELPLMPNGSPDDTVIEPELVEGMRRVWVEPSPNFTGVWTTYYVNGQRGEEIHYLNGKYFGELTSFWPNGAKCYVQQYGTNGIDGGEVGYFPSGHVSYRAQHKAGKNVGVWIWYCEDGTTRSTRDFTAQQEY